MNFSVGLNNSATKKVAKKKSFFNKMRHRKDNGDAPKIQTSKTKEFLSKLSGSFFIVIALMPLAGLCLGVGAAILAQISTVNSGGLLVGYAIGEILNQFGSALFGNLGLFFCIAIVMGFTKNWQSTMSSLWGYFIFNAFQAAILSTFAKNINLDQPASTFVLWFYQNAPVSVLATNVGFLSMNSSVIGGLLVAAITIWSWNKYKDTELPSFLSFFSGARFVPFVVTVAVIPLAFVYLLAWPIVGIGLVTLGQDLSNLRGWQFFIYTLIYRWLTPIGIHHAFYTIFWFTPVGGALSPNDWIYVGADKGLVGPGNSYDTIAQWLANNGKPSVGITYPQGDNGVWFFLERNGIPFNSYMFEPGASDSAVPGARILANNGLYLAPNYPAFIGGSIGSIAAMVYTSPKKDRKKVASIMGSALITTCAIGVTEPWLWAYILISPFLFFGFHSMMTAFGAYFMAVIPTKGMVGGFGGANLPGVNHLVESHSHVGTAFSTGILDYIIYGLIPLANGTDPYWIPALAFAYIFIYFGFFTFWIKFRKIQIPAIEEDGEIVEYSKEAARIQQNKDIVVNNLIIGLGGGSNIVSIFNCATRVRVDVKDNNKVSEGVIRKSGAIKVLILGNNIQVIYGPKAQTIAQKTNTFLKNNPTFGDELYVKGNTSPVLSKSK